MTTYETMNEAVNDLIKRGYEHDFNIEDDSILCKKNDQRLSPEEFEIDEIYRFEGDTDPGDENIVYAISSKSHNMKGILVNAYGTYSDADSYKVISRLKKTGITD
jgi:hypothetical protein